MINRVSRVGGASLVIGVSLDIVALLSNIGFTNETLLAIVGQSFMLFNQNITLCFLLGVIFSVVGIADLAARIAKQSLHPYKASLPSSP